MVATPFNIGNPGERTVEDLAQAILRLTGSPSELVREPLPEDDPKVRCPDITRAAEHLGWAPETDLDTGLGLTIDYFRGVLD
jgi:UDP-glucuronate decarboxylase